MILRYNNPMLEHSKELNGISIFEWLDQDWNKLEYYLKQYLKLFEEREDCKIELLSKSHQPMRSTKYNINHTIYDKDVKILLNNNGFQLKLNILIPKLVNGYFYINKNKKFSIIQLVDLPFINRKTIKNNQEINECRFITNFGVYKFLFDNKMNMYIFTTRLGKNYLKIPFVLFFLTYCISMGFNQFYEIYADVNNNHIKFKFKGEYEDFNRLFNQDIKEVCKFINQFETSNVDNELEYWYYMIGRYISKNSPAKRNKTSFIKFGMSLLNKFTTAIKMDWFSNKFYSPETLFNQIVNKFHGSNDEVNNLKNKRIRVTEYLIHKILIELYNQYLSLPLLKSAEKNIDLVNIWNSDSIKSNIQLSNKINPIACISEMDRLTYLGMGGFDSKHNLIELRDIHPSYYKNIDPIMTPDREKSGVVMNSCLLAKYDEDGRFLYIRGDE